MNPSYWFSHAALAAILAKVAEEAGDVSSKTRFAEASCWFLAQGMVSLAIAATAQQLQSKLTTDT